MKLYIPYSDPRLCVHSLDDDNVNASLAVADCILHSALSSTFQENAWVQWAQATRANYEWVYTYFSNLCLEHMFRFNCRALEETASARYLRNRTRFPEGERTAFPLQRSSREELRKYWHEYQPTWTRRNAPDWQ